MVKNVAIIGAGVSGLVAVKACLEEGLTPLCFEQQDQLGGLWYYTEDLKENDAVNIYNCLVTNTSKEMTCFSDFPFPADAPPFLSHKSAHEYLRSYAEHFQLTKHILFNTRKEDIRKAENHDRHGQWAVDTIHRDGTRTSYVFDAVIICTGIYRGEFFPSITGMNLFKGIITHSNRYKDGLPYKGKRVVVIGNRNSAGDIACDVSRYASKVYLSVGDGCWLYGHLDAGGLPSDMGFNRLTSHAPKWLLQWLMERKANAGVDHVNFGLRPPKKPLDAAKMLSEELPMRIACGAVVVVSEVIEIRDQDLILSDSSILDKIDCVIFATGYKTNRDVGMYSSLAVSDDQDNLKFFKYAFPIGARHNTMAFVGHVTNVFGTDWTPYDLQARLIARVFAGKHQLPSEKIMLDDAQKLEGFSSKSQRGITKVIALPFQDSIAEELGVKPTFWMLFLKNPKLAFSYYFGPSFSVYYRLCGPHAWEKAERACKDAYDNVIRGTKHRSVECVPNSVSFKHVLVLGVVGIFLYVLLNSIYLCHSQ